MLKSLHIRDFVLVSETQIEFAAGFTALTGETGAGKSILLDAIQFVLGARADAGFIRQGAAKLEVAAEFAASPAAKAWLADNDFASDDELLIRRTLDTSGKQRGSINGSLANAAQLRELGELCLDIHGQNSHQLLNKASAQRGLLDDFAQHAPLLQTVQAAWKNWQAAAEQLRTAQAAQSSLAQAREAAQWRFDQLNSCAAQAGEWQQLEQEHKRLANAAQLLGGVESAISALDEADESLLNGLDGVNSQLAQLAKLDQGLQAALEALDIARVNLSEAVSSLSAYRRQLDLDPARLEQLENRIALLHSTARKLKIAPEELPQAFEAVKLEIGQLQASSDIAALEKTANEMRQAYDLAAQSLSASRQAAAQKLGAAVSETMQTLALAGGQFAVAIAAQAASSSGIDAIEFQVASNVGSPLKALAKVASGGELSRISLAISVITSSQAQLPTLIFDEVDAGIGGAVAAQVGRRMQALAQHCQVLAVTHLPQVAAYAHQQLQVSKRVENGVTLSQLTSLSSEARVDEIARMLGGEHITVTTRYHAQELLNQAHDMGFALKG